MIFCKKALCFRAEPQLPVGRKADPGKRCQRNFAPPAFRKPIITDFFNQGRFQQVYCEQAQNIPFGKDIGIFRAGILSCTAQRIGTFQVFGHRVRREVKRSRRKAKRQKVLALLCRIVDFAGFKCGIDHCPAINKPIVKVGCIQCTQGTRAAQAPEKFVFAARDGGQKHLPVFHVNSFLLKQFDHRQIAKIRCFDAIIGIFCIMNSRLHDISPFRKELKEKTTAASTTAATASTRTSTRTSIAAGVAAASAL